MISIGYRDVSLPFSYLDERKQPIGYSIDLCMKIFEAVKKVLEMPRLSIRWQVVTSASRIPLVANGTVDIECGSTTNTLERQQYVGFTYTTFVAGTRLAWKKSAGFKALADLKGKRVVAVAGTTNLQLITKANAKRRLGMILVPVKDNQIAFTMVENGEAAAFITDDILLYGLIANSASPADYSVSRESLSVEPYAIMLRRDDVKIKRVADATLRELFESGDFQAIYSKWFLSPIPPSGIVMNVPMSASLKKAVTIPTDSALPSDY